jgi:hypothetical protein
LASLADLDVPLAQLGRWNGVHSPVSDAGSAQHNFPKPERKLRHRGADLIFGAKDFLTNEQMNPLDVLIGSTPSHSTFHRLVRRMHGAIDVVLVAEKQSYLASEKSGERSGRLFSPFLNSGVFFVTKVLQNGTEAHRLLSFLHDQAGDQPIL